MKRLSYVLGTMLVAVLAFQGAAFAGEACCNTNFKPANRKSGEAAPAATSHNMDTEKALKDPVESTVSAAGQATEATVNAVGTVVSAPFKSADNQ